MFSFVKQTLPQQNPTFKAKIETLIVRWLENKKEKREIVNSTMVREQEREEGDWNCTPTIQFSHL